MSTTLHFKIIVYILLLIHPVVRAQKITLAELHSMSSNKNWETSNKFLLSKGWEYYTSKTGDGNNYSTITWAYDKSAYSDNKASSWLYIYSYEGLPNKVMYRFRKKEYYTTIKNTLASNGYKLDNEEILDERVVAIYSNSNYILELTYAREENDDSYDGNGSYTAYEIKVYKKGGIYDPNNGKKEEFDENGNIAVEYFLKNGKSEGTVKFYNSDGTLRRSTFMKSGVENGTSISYIYDENDTLSTLIGKYKGEYIDGKKNGKWELIAFDSNVEKNISYEHYSNGFKNGRFTRATNDSLIVGNYKDDKLDGSYIIYRDFKKILVGGIITTDTLLLKKVTTGYYSDNNKRGHWKVYSLSGVLVEEGDYENDLRNGKWNYYYDSFFDEKGNELDFSGKLFLEENYLRGKRNGVFKRYSFLDEISEPCSDVPDEICTRKDFVVIQETSNYKDDLLNGSYILLNAEGELLFKGEYSNDKEKGIWIQKNSSQIDFWTGNTIEKGNYVDGKKQGKWERFNNEDKVIESYHYVDNQLEGEQVTLINGFAKVKREFIKNKLRKFTLFDSIGNIAKSFKIFAQNDNGYKCTYDIYSADTLLSYNYIVKLKEGEKIMPTIFNKTFENMTTDSKILEGHYEKMVGEKVLERGSYENNKKTGSWYLYFYDQNVRLINDYGYDEVIVNENYYDLKKEESFSGEFIYKDVISGHVEERKIKNGKRNGTTRYRDANNKTVKKESYKDGLLKE